jgi:transposase
MTKKEKVQIIYQNHEMKKKTNFQRALQLDWSCTRFEFLPKSLFYYICSSSCNACFQGKEGRHFKESLKSKQTK